MWILDLVYKGHRIRKRLGRGLSADTVKQIARREAVALRTSILLTGAPPAAKPTVTDLTVSAALKRFEQDAFPTLSPRTCTLYRHLMVPLRAHLGDVRLSALAPLDLERYKRARVAAPHRRATETGMTSANRELALLSAVFERCKTWRLLRGVDNPVAEVKRFKESKGRDRVLTREEEARLVAALPEPDRTLVLLAIQTGARAQSHLLPLTWADVDCAHARLRLYAGNAKNRKELWVPLGAAMVERLRTLQATRRSDLVFSAPGGGRLWHFSARCFKTVRTLGLGGTGLNIHALRHTFASRFAEATGDLLLLQRVGGWSSLALVQRYSHVREERGAEAIRKMLAAHDDEPAAPSARPTSLAGRRLARP